MVGLLRYLADALMERKDDQDQRWVKDKKKQIKGAVKAAKKLKEHHTRRTLPITNKTQ